MKILKIGLDQVQTKEELVGRVVDCGWCGCRFEIEREDLPKIRFWVFTGGVPKNSYVIDCPNCTTVLGIR